MGVRAPSASGHGSLRRMRPPNDLLHRAATLAAGQHGVLADRQLAALGVTRRGRESMVGAGQWERVTPAVLRCCAAPATPQQEAMAVLLDLGPCSALSRPSAIAVLGVDAFPLLPVHAAVPRGQRSRLVDPARVHTSHHLGDELVAVVDGLRCTGVELTLLDAAGWLVPGRLEHLVDRFWALGILDVRRALHMARTVGRGHRNVRELRALLEERDDGRPPPESSTEARFHRCLREDGQPALERQVVVTDGAGAMRVDGADPSALLVVEIQSRRYHGSISDARRDVERIERLRALGWTVAEVWEDEVWKDGPATARRIGQLRSRLRARRGHI